MTWLFALLVVAATGVTAVVAAGRGGSMSEVEDHPRPVLPPPGPVTAESLRSVRFTTAFRGYRMSEVDALLDRLAHDLHARAGGEATPHAGDGAADGEPRG